MTEHLRVISWLIEVQTPEPRGLFCPARALGWIPPRERGGNKMGNPPGSPSHLGSHQKGVSEANSCSPNQESPKVTKPKKKMGVFFDFLDIL